MKADGPTHRDLCWIALSWLLQQQGLDLGCVEIEFSGGFVDALAVSTRKAKAPYRIAVAEVKRTRPDLLQDLRASKMLKYEKSSTHCYLAATPEALGNLQDKEALEDLALRGLPPHWGVLVISGKACRSIRRAQRHKTLTYRSVISVTRKIAVSYMYRTLRSQGS
jgi:hypothetical protein